jgi:hypothetical protein
LAVANRCCPKRNSVPSSKVDQSNLENIICYRWIRFEIFNGLKEDTYLGHPLHLLLAPQQEEWAEYIPYEPLSVIWTM